MRHFSLENYFDAICGATMDRNTAQTRAKSSPIALRTIGVTGTQGIVMVGDPEHDVKGAAPQRFALHRCCVWVWALLKN